MKKKHEVKSYAPTTKGYGKLAEDDIVLADASRSVALTYLPQHFHTNSNDERIEGYKSLIEVANLAGFKVKTHYHYNRGKVVFRNRFPKYRDINYFNTLLADFKNEIQAIEYNPDDEHGLCDESVKVANAVYKYKDIIVRRIAKKSIFEKLKLLLKNIFSNK